jgi:flagellar hook assembly protein FlgD
VTDDQGRTGIDILPVSISFAPTVKISDNTLVPSQGGTVGIQSTLAGPLTVALLIQNAQHQTARTLVRSQNRAAASYSDSWDGTDDTGAVVPEGEYYVVLQYVLDGVTRTVDPSTSTGGSPFWPANLRLTTTNGGGCTGCQAQPYNNNFLQVDFDLDSAAEISASMRLLSSLVELAPIFERKPYGKGHSTVVWSGTDATGQIVTSPPGDALVLGLEAFTLPDNAIFVGDAPQLTGVTVTPNYFDPSTPDFRSSQGPAATVAFTVSKSCAVTLQVVNTGFNRLVRTIAVQSVPASAATITWDGRNDRGVFVDSGSYRLALQVRDANGNTSLVRYALVKVAY